MSNLVRRKFGGEILTNEEAIRLEVIKHFKCEELDPHLGDMFFYGREGHLIRIVEFKIEDVNFYLTNRIDRRHYLSMMPLLWQVKVEKEKEREQEKDFVTLVIGEMIKLYGDRVSTSDVLKRKHVWEAIEWWKAKKVKWKRPIKQDEAKALRMVISKLERDLRLR